ncbi:hypothetical protein AB0395_34935 [Streptosporangium sp. NPDC051023]|uniref:hypothetical protein n=1 Tax=Streptosporangium sp. NPDC051023 TaxID=3155410 RepID=UPI00344D7E27
MEIPGDSTAYPIRIEYIDPNPWDKDCTRRTGVPTQKYAGCQTLQQAERGAGHMSSTRLSGILVTVYDAASGTWKPYPCVWCGQSINCPRSADWWIHIDSGEAPCVGHPGRSAAPTLPVPCPEPVTPAAFWMQALAAIEDGERTNLAGLVERTLLVRYADLRGNRERLFGVENRDALEQHNGDRSAATELMDYYLGQIGYCNPGARVCRSDGHFMEAEELRRHVRGCIESYRLAPGGDDR